MTLAGTFVGDGSRTVLLLHGFLGQGRNLSSLARRWAEASPGSRFLLLDLPGHGSSPPLPPDAGLFELGGAVLGAARDHGVQGPLSIVGHSLGGRVGLAAALAAPGEVAEVTLLDIAPGPIREDRAESGAVVEALLAAPDTAPTRTAMRESLEASGLSRALADWLVTNLAPGGAGMVWRFDRAALAALHPRVNAGDVWGAVERGAARVRAIRGERSPYVPGEDVVRLRAAGAEVETLRGAGHFLHVDRPAELLEVLRRWHG